MRQLKIAPSVTLRTEVLEKYMRDVMNFAMVSPEEETELAIKIQNGNEEALNRLVEANLRFVISVAKQYQNLGLTLPDLINEGNIGLIKAAKFFDPTRGMKFITYAVWWIRQQIFQAISQNGRTVRVPVNKSGLATKISKVHDILEQRLQREPTTEELSTEMKLSAKAIQNAISSSSKSISLDMPTGDDNDGSMLDFLPDKSEQLLESLIEKEDLDRALEKAFTILSIREQFIVKHYFGIGTEECCYEEIALKINLSAERVRQIKDSAIKKLRNSSYGKTLLQFIK